MNNKLNKNKKQGGKAIASGGFGCVFSPALKCKGSSKKEEGKITKLMTEDHALKEYEEIHDIREKVKNIKNYRNYFLVDDLTLCEPEKLTENDLKDFNAKCNAFKNDKIKKSNINEKLSKMMALNIPYGGKPVDDYIYENQSFAKIYKLHIKLVQLLKYGIVPMNKKNVYHCDLKDSNILVEDKEEDEDKDKEDEDKDEEDEDKDEDKDEENKDKIKTRIIDWGLSTEYVPFKEDSFPSTWRNRPLQFNVPFSVIIFTESFVKKYTEYILNGGKKDEANLKPFVLDYLHSWIEERGPGHYKFINEIMYILFNNEIKNLTEENKKTLIESEFTVPYIINYIVQILIHFTKFRENGTLNLRDYLDNVFIEITDKWGFITVYFPLLELLHLNYDNLTNNQLDMFNAIKNLFIKYLYEPRIKPINLIELYKDLYKLGKLINKEEIVQIKLASGIKNINNKTTRKKFIKSLTGKTFIPSSSKRFFRRLSKNKTRKFKTENLFMVSKKRKYKNKIK